MLLKLPAASMVRAAAAAHYEAAPAGYAVGLDTDRPPSNENTMPARPRTTLVTIVAWALLLLGTVAVVAAVVLVYPRDVERRLWFLLFALAVVGASAIRSAVSLLRRPRVSHAPAPTPPTL